MAGVRLALRCGQVASGWLLVYVALVGTAVLASAQHYQYEPSCYPYFSADGVVETSCRHDWMNTAWSIGVGLPWFLTLFPALGFGLAKVSIVQGDWRYAANGLPFLLVSAPILLLIWSGGLYWWKQWRPVALVSLALIFANIIALGWDLR